MNTTPTGNYHDDLYTSYTSQNTWNIWECCDKFYT